MSEQELITVYDKFKQGKTDDEWEIIRHEMQVSYDKGSMAHFVAYLAEKYNTPKTDAWKIYKCLYHETWIGDLK